MQTSRLTSKGQILDRLNGRMFSSSNEGGENGFIDRGSGELTAITAQVPDDVLDPTLAAAVADGTMMGQGSSRLPRPRRTTYDGFSPMMIPQQEEIIKRQSFLPAISAGTSLQSATNNQQPSSQSMLAQQQQQYNAYQPLTPSTPQYYSPLTPQTAPRRTSESPSMMYSTISSATARSQNLIDRLNSPGKLRSFFDELKRRPSKSSGDPSAIPQLYREMVAAEGGQFVTHQSLQSAPSQQQQQQQTNSTTSPQFPFSAGPGSPGTLKRSSTINPRRTSSVPQPQHGPGNQYQPIAQRSPPQQTQQTQGHQRRHTVAVDQVLTQQQFRYSPPDSSQHNPAAVRQRGGHQPYQQHQHSMELDNLNEDESFSNQPPVIPQPRQRQPPVAAAAAKQPPPLQGESLEMDWAPQPAPQLRQQRAAADTTAATMLRQQKNTQSQDREELLQESGQQVTRSQQKQQSFIVNQQKRVSPNLQKRSSITHSDNQRRDSEGDLSMQDSNSNSKSSTSAVGRKHQKLLAGQATRPAGDQDAPKVSDVSPNNKSNTMTTFTTTTVGVGEDVQTTEDVKPKRSKTPDGMVRCGFCERTFNSDRLERHQKTCLLNPDKPQRKIMDGRALRTKGTEFEKFQKSADSKAAAAAAEIANKKQDWRKEHEQLVNSVRSARN